MLTPPVLNIRSPAELEGALVDLAQRKFVSRAADVFLERLDLLLPSSDISTNRFTIEDRRVPNRLQDPVPFVMAKTPYVAKIQDTMDMRGVHVVAVSGPARFSKTAPAENKMLRHAKYGPRYNVLFYMQSDEALNDYIDERGEWNLENHEGISELINWTDRRNSRTRKVVGGALWLWRVAAKNNLRGKAAPLIFVDEIDGYDPKIARAILTYIRNRQREFGGARLAYFCSHPDQAPKGGIMVIIAGSLRHFWFWRCPHPKCRRASSPCQYAEPRMTWNVGEFLKLAEDVERDELLEMILHGARLVCPHCRGHVDDSMRREISDGGIWLQPKMRLMRNGTVRGEELVRDSMGFIGHGMMSPFVTIGELARDWAKAKLDVDDGLADDALKEETCKSLGEVYTGARRGEQIDDWKTVKARLGASYLLRTVPAGVVFLIAFVDVQGDRFEVRVIGWDLSLRSWLIDAYGMKQWPAWMAERGHSNPHGAFENLDPSNRLSDWQIIEEAVVMSSYPLVSDPTLFLPIAKTVVDAAGEGGVTNNARLWLAEILARKALGRPGRIIDPYRILLTHGHHLKKGELYGKPTARLVDDKGKALPVQIFERQPIVHEIKKIIASRMQIADDAPGRMHLPQDVNNRHVHELVAESLIDDEWFARGRNETWDGWVNCEVGRATLMPERAELWSQTNADGSVRLPIWADPRPRGADGDIHHEKPVSAFDRLADLNREINEG